MSEVNEYGAQVTIKVDSRGPEIMVNIRDGGSEELDSKLSTRVNAWLNRIKAYQAEITETFEDTEEETPRVVARGMTSVVSEPSGGEVKCPSCGGPTWDNRTSKRNPKGPDYKCKEKSCAMAGWIRPSGDIRWRQ